MYNQREIGEAKKKLTIGYYNAGMSVEEICSRLDIAYSTAKKYIQIYNAGLKFKNEPVVEEVKKVEKTKDDDMRIKMEELYKRLEDIENKKDNQPDKYLDLSSLGFKTKDKRAYVKDDDGKKTQIIFISNQQINYRTSDRLGKTIDQVYFNANTIEAMFGALVERNWNYFRK